MSTLHFRLQSNCVSNIITPVLHKLTATFRGEDGLQYTDLQFLKCAVTKRFLMTILNFRSNAPGRIWVAVVFLFSASPPAWNCIATVRHPALDR
jgi:hypothetical protein